MGILFGILLVIDGLVLIIFPEAAWKMQHFLTVEGGEPSDFYMIFSRVLGVFAVIMGILFVTGVLG